MNVYKKCACLFYEEKRGSQFLIVIYVIFVKGNHILVLIEANNLHENEYFHKQSIVQAIT